MKEVVLDTETTGLSVKDGHRIVEIGCIELENLIPTKKTFHHYEMKFPDQDQLASQKLVQETLVEKNVVPFGYLLSYL